MKPGRVPKQNPLTPRRKGSGKEWVEETDMETGRRTTRPAGSSRNDPNDVGEGACSFIFLLLIGSPIAWLASILLQ
jgi:hypothetical protein